MSWRATLAIIVIFALIYLNDIVSKHNKAISIDTELVEISPKQETNEEIVARLAGEHKVLVCAIIETESGWNPNAISNTGDYGLMQINKKYWSNKFDWDRILEPEYNINAGIYILTACLDKANGDVRKALIYYNGSKEYPDRVLPKQKRYEG